MARDLNDTVVLGFGVWSDVYGLPTLGYNQKITAPVVPGVELRLSGDRLHYVLDAERLEYVMEEE